MIDTLDTFLAFVLGIGLGVSATMLSYYLLKQHLEIVFPISAPPPPLLSYEQWLAEKKAKKLAKTIREDV